jgi:hypothetical protein
MERNSMNGDEHILACEEKLRQAQLTGNVIELDRLLDESLIFTGLGGNVFGKTDDLNAHRSGKLRITRMEASDRRVQHFGKIAVVSVRMDAEAILDGNEVKSVLRYTRVWCARPEGWRIVAGHMSVAAG